MHDFPWSRRINFFIQASKLQIYRFSSEVIETLNIHPICDIEIHQTNDEFNSD